MNATPPCCTEDWGWNRITYRKVRDELRLHRPMALGSAWLRGRFHGCMTNMLLAKGCMSEFARTPAQVQQARDIVRDFAFVGLQSQWHLSICLFNRILTGRRFTLRHQLANVQAGGQLSQVRSAAHVAAAAARLQRHAHRLPRDPIDGPLYEYVEARWRRDVARHGVRAECCPTYETLQQAAGSRELCSD